MTTAKPAKVRVAVNGYDVTGKRVADAVRLCNPTRSWSA